MIQLRSKSSGAFVIPTSCTSWIYFSLKARQAQPKPAQAHEFGPDSQSYEAQALPGRAQAPGFDPGPALNITNIQERWHWDGNE